MEGCENSERRYNTRFRGIPRSIFTYARIGKKTGSKPNNLSSVEKHDFIYTKLGRSPRNSVSEQNEGKTDENELPKSGEHNYNASAPSKISNDFIYPKLGKKARLHDTPINEQHEVSKTREENNISTESNILDDFTCHKSWKKPRSHGSNSFSDHSDTSKSVESSNTNVPSKISDSFTISKLGEDTESQDGNLQQDFKNSDCKIDETVNNLSKISSDYNCSKLGRPQLQDNSPLCEFSDTSKHEKNNSAVLSKSCDYFVCPKSPTYNNSLNELPGASNPESNIITQSKPYNDLMYSKSGKNTSFDISSVKEQPDAKVENEPLHAKDKNSIQDSTDVENCNNESTNEFLENKLKHVRPHIHNLINEQKDLKSEIQKTENNPSFENRISDVIPNGLHYPNVEDCLLKPVENEESDKDDDDEITVIEPPPSTANDVGSGSRSVWIMSKEKLSWDNSSVASYNPKTKMFQCVVCQAVGFMSRIGEHYLGTHCNAKVFHCPQCTYSSAWWRCVRNHMNKNHGVFNAPASMWKNQPLLDEIMQLLQNLKYSVDCQDRVIRVAENSDKRYICPKCPYATDRRDLYNRHENIHREEKPFQCYICYKLFNRADHVKKHFCRIHKDYNYDINLIRRLPSKRSRIPLSPSFNGLASSSGVENNSTSSAPPISSSTTSTNSIPVTQSHLLNCLKGISPIPRHPKENDGLLYGAKNEERDGTPSIVPKYNSNLMSFLTQNSSFQKPYESPSFQKVIENSNFPKSIEGNFPKPVETSFQKSVDSSFPKSNENPGFLKQSENSNLQKPLENPNYQKPPENSNLSKSCDSPSFQKSSDSSGFQKLSENGGFQKPIENLSFQSSAEYLGLKKTLENSSCQKPFDSPCFQKEFEMFPQRINVLNNLKVNSIHSDSKVGSSVSFTFESDEPRKFYCPYCPWRGIDTWTLRLHISTHFKTYSCVLCDYKSAQETDLEVHLWESHRKRSCSKCNFLADSIILLDAHMKEVHGSKHQFTCRHCSQPFEVRSDMEAHCIFIHNQVLQECKQDGCDFCTTDPNILDCHRHERHGLPAISQETKSASENTLCLYCGCDFADSSSLSIHLQVFHENPLQLAAQRPLDPYCCAVCGHGTPSQQMMMEHMRIHTGQLLHCQAGEGCYFRSPYDSVLREHVLQLHSSDDGIIRCPHCGCRCSSRFSFVSHYQEHHHPFMCQLCEEVEHKHFTLANSPFNLNSSTKAFFPFSNQIQLSAKLAAQDKNCINTFSPKQKSDVAKETAGEESSRRSRKQSQPRKIVQGSRPADPASKDSVAPPPPTTTTTTTTTDVKNFQTGSSNRVNNFISLYAKKIRHLAQSPLLRCRFCIKCPLYFRNRKNHLLHTQWHCLKKHHCSKCIQTFSHRYQVLLHHRREHKILNLS